MITLLAIALILMLPLARLLHSCAGWWQQHRRGQRQRLKVIRLRRQQHYLLLWLATPDGKPLPKARAGQHLQLFYHDLQGQPLSRAYSLAQDCHNRHYYRLAIKLEAAGRLTPALFSQLKTGNLLEVSAPTGAFRLRGRRKAVVLVAGGVGITPLLSMAMQALRQRRRVTLVYQAKTAEHLLFHRLLRRLPGLTYLPFLSQPPAAWTGNSGRISAERLLAIGGPNADYYCCASHSMTAQLQAGLQQLAGKPLQHELFSAALSKQNFPLQYRHISAGSAGFRSVLDALNSQGANIPFDCRGGSCGLCKKRLLSGEVCQTLEPAVPLQSDEILTCCVQAKSALVLVD